MRRKLLFLFFSSAITSPLFAAPDYLFLQETHQSADGYFINYGSHAYDWAYFPKDLKSGFKLEGLDESAGYFLWQTIYGSGIDSFDSVTLNASSHPELCFGSSQNGAIAAIGQLASQCHPIQGVFSNVGSDPFDWVYGSLADAQTYKLEGMNPQNGLLQWTSLNSLFENVDVDYQGIHFHQANGSSSSSASPDIIPTILGASQINGTIGETLNLPVMYICFDTVDGPRPIDNDPFLVVGPPGDASLTVTCQNLNGATATLDVIVSKSCPTSNHWDDTAGACVSD